MTFGCIILIHNQLRNLKLILSYLDKLSCTYDKIVVIDDNSDIDIVNNIKLNDHTIYHKLEYDRSEPGKRAEARNIGAELCNTDYITFLDGDCIISKDYLKILKSEIKRSKSKTIFMGTRFNIDDVEGMDFLWNNFSTDNHNNKALHEYEKKVHAEFIWDLIYSNNLTFKRLEFINVGKFNPKFRGWGFEDTELGYRLYRNKFNFYFVKEMLAFHIKHESTREYKSIERNILTFINLHPNMEVFKSLHRILTNWHTYTLKKTLNDAFFPNKKIDIEYKLSDLELNKLDEIHTNELNYFSTACPENILYFKELEVHKKRIFTNAEIINNIVKKYNVHKILNIGKRHYMNKFLDYCGILENCKVQYTWFDLRNKIYPYLSNTFDFIINTEVIEHLKDPEKKKYRDVFTGKSMNRMLSECYRILKPGGIMLLTTPNCSSYNTMYRTINDNITFSWHKHVRELSIEELFTRIHVFDYEILGLETKQLYEYEDNFNKNNFKRMKQVLKNNFSIIEELKNDTFYILLRKPLNKK